MFRFLNGHCQPAATCICFYPPAIQIEHVFLFSVSLSLFLQCYLVVLSPARPHALLYSLRPRFCLCQERDRICPFQLPLLHLCYIITPFSLWQLEHICLFHSLSVPSLFDRFELPLASNPSYCCCIQSLFLFFVFASSCLCVQLCLNCFCFQCRLRRPSRSLNPFLL